MHYLARRLGALKGLVIHGERSRISACARAGQGHRLPMIGICEHPVEGASRELIEVCGCELDELPQLDELQQLDRARELAVRMGYALFPSMFDPDFALGVATLGLELGAEMPADLERVYVAMPFAPAIQSGLGASGHGARAVAVDMLSWRQERCQDSLASRALAESLGLLSDGAATLSQALADGAGDESCVILSC